MKVIGSTQSGSLLIEMSPEEYNTLFASTSIVQEIHSDMIERKRWAADFRRQFDQLSMTAGISSRAHGAFTRGAIRPLVDGLDEAIQCDQSYPSPHNYFQRKYRNSVELFSDQGKLLTFEEWIEIAPSRTFQLKQIRNLGRIGFAEIMRAIDLRRAENGTEQAQPV
jgi:hypothetical protein